MKSNKRTRTQKTVPLIKEGKTNAYALLQTMLALLIVMLCASLLFSLSSSANRFHRFSVSQQLEYSEDASGN